MTSNFRSLPVITLLTILSLPLVIMYAFTLVDTVTDAEPGSLIPSVFTLHHWRFLWDDTTGRGSVWIATINTFIFAGSTAAIVCATSLTSAYALSRLNFPARRFFLAGVIILHAFPTITLIIAIFLILQFLGLFDTLIGVIMVKAALELPFGIWVMKGFYDTVPWEIEMAGVQDGASRFMVWRKLVLPQVQPGLSALLIFSFLSGWSEFILPLVLAPGSDAQVLSTYLAYFLLDDSLEVDFNLFKSVGLFYALPVILIYLVFQKKLMNIYGGGSKG
ncbi:carbohydrate ABC transporter permease [Ruegeria lacuscaerulensis]|uniref:carbohydrate ABC transporter permease n=1 Tax=Ruegeria lacuscaerulensis TaxID=55218 RepID=UPI00147C06BB|nr:carbohydrate ABC transporter permease [Ruegeria lacuscaerulensis]